MKILTEIGWGEKPGGARKVALSVLQCLAQSFPEHEYYLVSNRNFASLDESPVKQICQPAWNYVPKVVWDQLFFPHYIVPRICAQIQPDLIHYTNNIVSFWGKTPAVVTLHDMTPFILPESFAPLHGIYQRFYFKQAVQKAARIITVSENSKQDICSILGVEEKKIVVAPLASELGGGDNDKTVPHNTHEKFVGGRPYLLYVGAIHPRKNVKRIVQAFSRLKTEEKIPHSLVIAGAQRWQTGELHKALADCPYADQIVFTGALGEEELVGLYRHCAVFVWPSLYEGFGLPVLEAMQCGAPVVTSNCSSLPEVAGDAAILVDPHSVAAIAEGISRVLSDSDLAENLRQKGRMRAKKFSWQKTASIIADTYRSVVGS